MSGPTIKIDGDDAWRDGYDGGDLLDAKFPGQESTDFAYCIAENGFPGWMTSFAEVEALVCTQVGENDEASWVWLVTVNGRTYEVEGWCDYTGWDCQSGYTSKVAS